MPDLSLDSRLHVGDWLLAEHAASVMRHAHVIEEAARIDARSQRVKNAIGSAPTQDYRRGRKHT